MYSITHFKKHLQILPFNYKYQKQTQQTLIQFIRKSHSFIILDKQMSELIKTYLY